MEPSVSASGGRTQDLTLRRYRATDANIVWELHNLGLLQVDAHPGNGEWDADLHEIEAVYLAARGEFLVGECDDRLVAMGALLALSEDRAEIKRMRVHPDFQGRGFGRVVLELLEATAQAFGYRELCLETTTRQTVAQALYTSSGYRETHRRQVGPFTVLGFRKLL